MLRSLAIAEILPNALRWNSVDGGGNTCPALWAAFWGPQPPKTAKQKGAKDVDMPVWRWIHVYYVCMYIYINVYALIHISYIILWSYYETWNGVLNTMRFNKDRTVEKMLWEPTKTKNVSKFRNVSNLGTPNCIFFQRPIWRHTITSKNPIKSTSQHLDGCRGHGHPWHLCTC